jgi:exodeoxyribonuclease VII small subunit
MAEKLTYTKAVEEIEAILSRIENDELDVDELSTNVKRAAKLIKYCKEKLKKTEEEVSDILNEIEE